MTKHALDLELIASASINVQRLSSYLAAAIPGAAPSVAAALNAARRSCANLSLSLAGVRSRIDDANEPAPIEAPAPRGWSGAIGTVGPVPRRPGRQMIPIIAVGEDFAVVDRPPPDARACDVSDRARTRVLPVETMRELVDRGRR